MEHDEGAMMLMIMQMLSVSMDACEWHDAHAQTVALSLGGWLTWLLYALRLDLFETKSRSRSRGKRRRRRQEEEEGGLSSQTGGVDEALAWTAN
ncbi:hypothetical protein J3E73DRAFT_377375 [Bipolaris maydis]|nr:hypothetical protein J3E73DRAFT_377375 [Bipolaris maydis]